MRWKSILVLTMWLVGLTASFLNDPQQAVAATNQCPPPPGQPDPPGCVYIIDVKEFDIDLHSHYNTLEHMKHIVPTNRWVWDYPNKFITPMSWWRVIWDPGYPRNEWRYDSTSDKLLAYLHRGTEETEFYIVDNYISKIREYFDQWRLEKGTWEGVNLIWSRIIGVPRVRYTFYNDNTHKREFVPPKTYGPAYSLGLNTNDYFPAFVIYFKATWDPQFISGQRTRVRFPVNDPRSPRSPLVKNPPEYSTSPGGPKPPITGWPLDWLGDEIICDNCKSREVLKNPGQWLFGGRPVENLFSATRGTNAILAIDTLAQGDLSVPPAGNKVTQVIIRIPDIPGAQAKAALYQGTPQKGQWLTSLWIPPDTKVRKYQVVFEVHGYNYWGQPRTKVVYGWLWVDGGDCPATDRNCQKERGMLNPGEVSFCGLSEDEMRALGDRWIYKCNDPRLVK